MTAGAGPRKAVRYLISGRVQGVYFRGSTVERARRLELDGWARNLPDGRVEVVAAGEEERLAELAAWLWRGPVAARVEGVRVEEWGDAVPHGFSVR